MNFQALMRTLDNSPRLIFMLISVVCIALLSFGQYLQHVVGLEPCPMCIVQRYALMMVVLISGLTAISNKKGVHIAGAVLMLISAGFGAYVAARQSWLQWYPPEVVSCGRDFYGMIEAFPLQRAIPMIFKGSGDCSKIDWVFLGGSIANWSFLSFVGVALLSIALILRPLKRR
jgi:disulfide bond formation protein DsbB